MNKIPKYVVIIACILAMVVLLPLGYVRYKTRYEAEQISVSTSPDGDYELVIYSVGDPGFSIWSCPWKTGSEGQREDGCI